MVRGGGLDIGGDGAMGRCERLTLAWLIVAVVFVLGEMALKDIRHQW